MQTEACLFLLFVLWKTKYASYLKIDWVLSVEFYGIDLHFAVMGCVMNMGYFVRS